MSYILEALKKADAERERDRGAVPGLSALTPSPAGPAGDAAAVATIPWLWLGAGAVLAFGVVLAWQFGRPDPLPASMSAPPPTAQVVQGPTPPAPSAMLPPPAVAEPDPPLALEPAAQPAPVRRPERGAADRARRDTPTAVAGPKSAADPAAKARKRASSAAPERTPSLAELPDDLRRRVPPIGIGGSVYSALPENRMLVVNGQVLREGGTVAAGLQLEQIGPKAAVFSIHGHRFEMPL